MNQIIIPFNNHKLMALNYEYERAIAQAEFEGNRKGARFLKNQLDKFRSALMYGLIRRDLYRETEAEYERIHELRKELHEPYLLAEARGGLIFIPELVTQIADFLEISQVETHHHSTKNGITWTLEKKEFSLELTQEQTSRKLVYKNYLSLAYPNTKYLTNFPFFDPNSSDRMEDISMIGIEPTITESEGSVIFTHRSNNVSISLYLKKDGRRSFNSEVAV